MSYLQRNASSNNAMGDVFIHMYVIVVRRQT